MGVWGHRDTVGYGDSLGTVGFSRAGWGTSGDRDPQGRGDPTLPIRIWDLQGRGTIRIQESPWGGIQNLWGMGSQDTGIPGYGTSAQRTFGICDPWDMGPLGYGTLGIWDLWDLGPLGFGTLGIWDLWDMGPLGYGTPGIWDLWDLGPLGFGTLGIWDLWDLGPLGYGTFGIWDLWDMGPLGYGTLGIWDPWDMGPHMIQYPQIWDPPGQAALGFDGYGDLGLLSDCCPPSLLPWGPQGRHPGGQRGAVALGGFGAQWLWVLTGGWTGMRCCESRHGDTAAPGAPVPHTWGWGHVCPQGSVTPGCVYGDTAVPKGGASPDLVTGPRLPLAQGHQDSRGDAAQPPQPLGAVGTRRWGHAHTHTAPLCVLVPTPGLILPLAVPVPTWLSSTPAGSPGSDPPCEQGQPGPGW